MNLFELVAKITLDTKDVEKGIGKVKSLFSSVGNGIKNGFSAAVKVGTLALSAAATGVAAFGAASIKTGAQFDASMSQVAATMGKTVDEIQDLRDFALEMGSTTAFSASQAADALNYMALAGYDAQTSMEVLPTVLNLAAAGGIDLAAASDMITDAQSALGLSVEESTVMVDQMAAAASKSNTSVEQLGSAFLTVGATARNLQGGTEELSTLLGVLADNGIKGAEGGTHLRNILLSLQNAVDDKGIINFNNGIEKVSVSLYDADGNMRSIVDVIGEMQNGMEGMSQASKDALIGGMFNRADLASVNALLGTSQERFEDLSASIRDSGGAAAKMADTQLDNLQGDITLLKSAFEGFQIAVSDKLTPSFRKFVQFGSEGLSRLTTAFQEGGISGAVDELANLLEEGLSMIMEELPGFIEAGSKILEAIVDGVIDNLPTIAESAGLIVGKVVSGIISAIPKLLKAVPEIVKAIVTGLEASWPEIKEAGMELLAILWDGVSAEFNSFREKVGKVWENIKTVSLEKWSSIKSGIVQRVDSIKSSIVSKFDSIRSKISDVADKVKNIFNFQFSIPKIKLPHFVVKPDGWQIGDLLRGIKPSLDIQWYKKAYDNPYMFTKPTVMQGFGDGNGAEMVYGRNNLLRDIHAAASDEEALEVIIGLLRSIVQNGVNANINRSQIYSVVNEENRVRTRATNYNALGVRV